jgi:hypothetical protein
MVRGNGDDMESDTSYMVKGNANDMQSEAQSYIMRAESVDSESIMQRGVSIDQESSVYNIES